MGERQDFSALDWVTSELTETLAQAQHAIAAYEEDNSDLTRLQFSLTYLHQVRGTLEMVEVYGAALLARELEHLAQFLVQNPAHADSDNLSLLLQGILQLPAYLERLQQGSADHPAIMAPLINDIRAARELGPVDESQLFSPDLTSEESTLAVPVDPNSLTPDARERLRKLRQLFQFSLLGLLHGKDIEQNHQYMHKAAQRLAEQLGDTGIGFLWHIAAALLEAHEKGLLPDDIDLRPALSRLERQLGHLIQATNEGRSPTVDVRLLQRLLYYIARADAQTRDLADLQSRFSLQALPSEEDARVVSGREALRGPDRSTVANVSAVLVEELTEVKDQLDIFVRDRSANPQRLSELLQPLRQISDTMSMLQLGQAKRVLDEQVSSLEALSREPAVEPQSVMDVAGGLLYVESTLTGLDQGYREPQASGSNEVNSARRALISEVRNAIESCKEAVVSYIGSQWDTVRLTETPEWLRQIEANLAMIPLPEPAAVITSVRHYMQRELIDGGERHPDWTQMDKLADALMGVDYFLERLPRDQDKAPDGSILKRARASLRELGYPVAEIETEEMPESETAVKSSLDDYFEHVSELDENAIDTAWSDAEESATADIDESEFEMEATAESDPEPVEEPPAASAAELEDDDDDLIDDDIRDIFLEEAGEVLDDIRDWYPRYKADPENSEALTEFRRSFHTLKGSGRMVNASVVGELAWAVENMLNRLIDGSIARSEALVQLLDDVIERLPDLIDDFAQGRASNTARVDALAARAEALSRGELPPEEDPLPVAEDEAPTESTEAEIEEAPDTAEVSTLDDDLAELLPEEDDAGDERLYSIFQQEIRLHLEEVRAYLERHRHELEAPVEDGLQRALHTIKGSAHMAGITVMAEMVGPVEHVVRDLQSLREPVDETVMVLLEDVAGRVEEQLKALDQQETPGPATDNFFSLVKDINARLADIKSTGQAEPSSNLMSIFLNEAMNTVLSAEDTLQEWQQSGLEDSRLRLLRRDLITLADAARAIELLPLSSLANQLILLYEFLEQHPPESSDHPAFDGLYRAHEAIIDMMDRLAAGQSVQEQTALETELAELANAPLAGPSELPVDENDYALSNLTAQRGHTEAPAPVENEAEPAPAEDQPPWPEVTGKEPGAEPIASEIDEPEPAEAAAPESVSANEETPPWDTGDNDANAEESVPAEPEPEAELESGAEPELEPQAEPEVAAPELPATPAAVGEWVALQDSDPEVLEIFLEEADELLASIGEELDTWQKAPADRSPVTALQRDLHTLKGGARMAEAAAVADLAHELEFIYEGLGTGQMAASQALLQEVQRSQDQLAQMVQDLHERQGCHEATEQILRLQALRRGETPARAKQASPQHEAEAPEKTALDAATDSADFFSPVELESLDPDILEVFMDEAIELINELDESITAWRDRPSNELAADEMKRVLHTLKGGARLARLPSLGTLSHELETYVIRAQQNRVPLDDQFFTQVLNQYDLLATGVEQLQAVMDSGAPNAGGASEEAAESNVVPFQRPESQDEQKAETGDSSPSAGSSGNAAPARRTQPQETVKVSANLLENLVNLAGESSISRARLEEQVNDLGFTLNDLDTTIDRLREKVRQLDIETEAQVLFRQERAEETNYEDFDPLEMDRYTQIQELSRSLMETSSDLVDLRNTLSNKSRDAETVLLQQSRIHSDLQEGLMQTRMVPFARLVPRLRRIVRQVCNELDKQARFDIENAEGEMDRSVLERMVSPLEHMLRNAVDHGIEPVAEREKAGKAAEGSIRLNLQREGGDVVLRLSDDGSGINVDNVKAKAIERGLMAQGADLSDHEILQFILTSGFSTAQKVTQISGRGVGMDVVHNEVKALGGTMDIATTPGTGTTFTVRLPFTVSVNRALMVGFGEDIYAIPLNTIDGVARVQPAQLAQYLDDENARFAYGTTQYRVRSLSDIMGSGHAVHVDELTEPQPVILVKALDRQEPLAMHVDRLMGSREVVVKTLGPQFAAVPSVSGATILGDGSVVVILDLPALLRSEVTTYSLEEAPEPAEDEVLALPDSSEPVEPVRAQRDESQPLTVMVVDDSVTVRKVTGRLLERQGMKVITAKDGMDAITQLQDFEPDIILLDIEMPRMDGFEVANRVRHTERLSQIPIIMITSRTGEKHKERAFEIGVNDYMGKPFQEGPLLEAIGRLVDPDEQ